MSKLALAFADGAVFFPGMALAALAFVLAFALRRRPRFKARMPLLWGAGALVAAASATPLPAWEYAVWGLMQAAAIWLLMLSRRAWPAAVLAGAAIAAVGATAALIAQEGLHRRLPAFEVPSGAAVYVLGDSLSAGLEDGERTWPDELAAATGWPVTKLARAGAGVADGMRQAEAIGKAEQFVFVELGGNDLLGVANGQDFERDLDRLLSALSARGDRIAMFELPLPPLCNRFGLAQRRLAARHGVTLIPKRVLTRALGLEGGTSDGLHLSPKGHAELGRFLASRMKAVASR